VLVKTVNPDGTTVYVPKTVNVYEAVFSSTDVTKTNVDAFAQAADDARAVIEYVHDNAIPETN